MDRRAMAIRLALIVALSGVLPIVAVSIAGLVILRSRGRESAQEALHAVAGQAAARVATWVAQQHEMLRTVAMAVATEADSARRLTDVQLDAPSLGHLRIVTPESKGDDLPQHLGPADLAVALSGKEVSSETYIAELSPAQEVCVPTAKLGRAVCATMDLLELQRQVQHITVGESGYALAFDRTGRLVGAGDPSIRAAVLSGEPVSESPVAAAFIAGAPAPLRFDASSGNDVLAGWAAIPELKWSIAVEQPTNEALRGVREGLWLLLVGGGFALGLSIALGAAQARKVLATLERDERWRTAGKIAAGISHDLGHRLAILTQTANLAEMNDVEFLPRIRDSLRSEIATLKKFVADFADLTREPKPADFMPIELNALAASLRSTATPYAEKAGVKVETKLPDKAVWVKGDRYLLERAALNLVYNAIDACAPGKLITIHVAQEGTQALLRVEDQGTGIAAERLPSLFDSFNSTKRTGAHVGMGLPNVHRICTAHGGAVGVTSEEGKGSIFTISLPADEDHSSSLSSAAMP